MARLALLLLIFGGLAIFALQNLAPFPLVILGMQTPAFPIAVWMVGAIAAGSFTTLVLAGLFKASNAVTAARSRRSTKRRSNRSSANTTSGGTSFWQASAPKPNPNPSPRSSGASSVDDDWERGSRLEEWEDWEGYQEPAKPEPVDRSVADASAANRSQSAPRYEPPPAYESYRAYEPPQPEKEEWEDWDEYEEEPPREEEPSVPRRTDFEVKQEPKARSQSGSMYSYRYRDSEEPTKPTPEATPPVYDAEYRVLTPPYRPDPVEPPPKTDDDWEFGDDDSDWNDSSSGRGSRQPRDWE